jgi:hypothetical protein
MFSRFNFNSQKILFIVVSVIIVIVLGGTIFLVTAKELKTTKRIERFAEEAVQDGLAYEGADEALNQESEIKDAIENYIVIEISDEIVNTYEGGFDESKFLKAINQVLHFERKDLEYSDVAVITFTAEEYWSDNSDIVGRFVIFNHDESRKALTLYSKSNKTYAFILNYKKSLLSQESQVPDIADVVIESVPEAILEPAPIETVTPMPEKANFEEVLEHKANIHLESIIPSFLEVVIDEGRFLDAVNIELGHRGYGDVLGVFNDYLIEGDIVAFVLTLEDGTTLNGTYDIATGNYTF